MMSLRVAQQISQTRKVNCDEDRDEDQVMVLARLTSPFLDGPRQSSPRPRLRHGRPLALLFHPNITLNLYTLFFALSLALLPPLLTFLTIFLPGSRLRSMPLT